jgi:hypothetical protein
MGNNEKKTLFESEAKRFLITFYQFRFELEKTGAPKIKRFFGGVGAGVYSSAARRGLEGDK